MRNVISSNRLAQAEAERLAPVFEKLPAGWSSGGLRHDGANQRQANDEFDEIDE